MDILYLCETSDMKGLWSCIRTVAFKYGHGRQYWTEYL